MYAYMINLARSADRRAHMTAELAKTGIEYEIVTGVEGRDLDLRDPALFDGAWLATKAFPAGAAGCASSHHRVYQKILEDGRDKALILEDDITLTVGLDKLADAVAEQLDGAEIALLEYASPEICRMSSDGVVGLPDGRLLALPIDIHRLMNAGAYVITREACERMVARTAPMRRDSDDWQFYYSAGVLDRIRCVVPNAVAKNGEFDSTIGFYSLGNGLKARLVGPLVRRRIPVVRRLLLRRRQHILNQWCRVEIVDMPPFIEKPSRLV